MKYRAAALDDAPALSRLAARLFVASYQHLMARAELEAYCVDHFSDVIQSNEVADLDLTTFLAFDEEMIAYAQLASGRRPGCPLQAASPAELKRIYVDAAAHGRGVAQQLLQRIEQEARARGHDVLWLAVWELNPRAIAFYQKSGFTDVGRQGFPIGHEVQSDLVMCKPLANELR